MRVHPPLQALAAALAPKAKAVRDGQVMNMEAVNLVPGDVIIVRLGDVLPADVKILAEEGGGGGGEEVPMQVRARVTTCSVGSQVMRACGCVSCMCAMSHKCLVGRLTAARMLLLQQPTRANNRDC
jgi:hypothetical protein